jgi:steroid delta-isomerase-like uncharacterized protein
MMWRYPASFLPTPDSLSRRGVIARIGAGGLGLALAARLGLAAAQTTLPPALKAWVDAWNGPTNPAAAIAALYTSDGVYEDVPSNTHSAPGKIDSFLTPFLKGISEVKVEPVSGFSTSDWAALEYRFSAKNQGVFPGPAGKAFDVRIATIFELSGDKISRSSDYYDDATILTQLGVLPGSGATPVASPMA